MKINTKYTDIDPTPAITEYVEKKINMIEKFFGGIEDVLVNVEVGKTTQHHNSGDIFKAEIHLMIDGEDYYALAKTEDLYVSIDKVKDDIVRQLTSGKKKALRLFRQGGAKIKNMLRGVVQIKDKSWNKIKNFRNKK